MKHALGRREVNTEFGRKTWKKETTWELEYRRRVKNINASQKEIECEGVDGTDAAQWPIVLKR